MRRLFRVGHRRDLRHDDRDGCVEPAVGRAEHGADAGDPTGTRAGARSHVRLYDTVLPVLALPTLINPETMNLLALAALAANTDPHGANRVLEALPRNLNIVSTLRIPLSKDYGTAITGQPDILRIRATNEATLGAIMDDNSMPFGILQASIGMVAPGGPVQAKSFPVSRRCCGGIPYVPCDLG